MPNRINRIRVASVPAPPPVQKPAVVGDDEGGAGETGHCRLQRAQRVHVQIVRRLVEQQQVAALLQHLGEEAVRATGSDQMGPEVSFFPPNGIKGILLASVMSCLSWDQKRSSRRAGQPHEAHSGYMRILLMTMNRDQCPIFCMANSASCTLLASLMWDACPDSKQRTA
jgi:hypothetical protein